MMADKGDVSQFDTIFGWGVGAVITAAIIAGLIMVGGPGKARDQKIDAKRLNNMQMTARIISCYADYNEGLPETITPAKQALGTGNLSRKDQRCLNLKWETDPVSGTEFEYKRLGEYSFELCGVFAREGLEQDRQRGMAYYNTRIGVLDTHKIRESSGRYCYSAKNWDETES